MAQPVIQHDAQTILATVGKKEIKNKDLDRIIEKYPTEKRIYFQTETGRSQLLDQKIAFTLFSEYAKEKGKDQEEDYIDQINDLKEQLLTQRVMQELFAQVSVSEEEVQAFYKEHPEHFRIEETVSVRHILMETLEKAKICRQEIQEGNKDFAQAAKDYSICPSKEKGGEMGYFKRGMMAEEFETAAFTLPLHSLSEPVKTQFGYHLLEVLDKTQPGEIPYDDCKDSIREQLTTARQQVLYETKLRELKEKYAFSKNESVSQ